MFRNLKNSEARKNSAFPIVSFVIFCYILAISLNFLNLNKIKNYRQNLLSITFYLLFKKIIIKKIRKWDYI